MNKIAAVVGARGDLGSQVVKLLDKQKYQVIKVQRDSNFRDLKKQHIDVVHYCIPANSIKQIGGDDTLHILHDSVMDSSKKAIKSKLSACSAAPVHMFMNKSKTAIIGRGFKGTRSASAHLKELGMNTQIKSTVDHDKIIARSQAPMLILSNTILKDLVKWQAKGLLTPSGEDLLKALESRNAQWTESTKRSILMNPEIKKFIKDMFRLH